MSNTTGNKIVDEISALHINSIPETWYHTIKRNNQPHAMAILILWDLVYWYKWTEVRDEASGLVIGYKKKFKADLLQRSYEAIGNKFGISKRQATDVIVFLEKMGAVKRVFRNIRVANTTLSNVLFIELVPSVIKELCNADLGEVSRNGVGGSHADSGDGLSELGETYTTTSTNNTTIISNYSTSLNNEPPKLSDFNNETKKVTRSKKTNTQQYEEYISSLTDTEREQSAKCVDLFIELHKQIDPYYNRDKSRLCWQVEFAKFQRESHRSYVQILQVIRSAMTNPYRNDHIYKPEYIFNNFEDIVQSLNKTNPKYDYQKKRDGAIERSNMITDNDDEYKLF